MEEEYSWHDNDPPTTTPSNAAGSPVFVPRREVGNDVENENNEHELQYRTNNLLESYNLIYNLRIMSP